MFKLTDNIKTQIRTIHQRIKDNLPNYQPRKQQNYLVAEIAKTLGGEYHSSKRICVIEAGTGTGKSLAYCLGAIVMAKAQDRKVVISTATVALQEQLIDKDLPFFAKVSELDFQFDLVKGRQRYCCGQKLAMFGDPQASEQDYQQLLLAPPSNKDQQLLSELYQAYNTRRWDGDRDSWSKSIPDSVWQHIVGDKHSCSRKIKEHKDCPFHIARERIKLMDVLVVNHALLLADLELGGGKILPAPDETIYVLDEGHHLPQITRDHASAQATVLGAKEWMEKLPNIGHKLNKVLTTSKAISISLKIQQAADDAKKSLDEVYMFLQHNHHQLFGHINEQQDNPRLRFENGELPDPLLRHAEDLAPTTGTLESQLEKLQELLKEEVADESISSSDAEPLFTELGFYSGRVENLHKLWQQWSYVPSAKSAPNARWIEIIKHKNGIDYLTATAPIEVGYYLADKLWNECAGAIICSATLTALNKFDYFRFDAGLFNDDGTQYLRVDSPFDYQNKGELHLPLMHHEPSSPKFTDELIEQLPGLLEGESASLVLFSSYWQMEMVADKVEKQLKRLGIELLIQGQKPRQTIISRHKKTINAGKNSVIFGSQSFSEGLDLPGKYLTNVIITKVPFAVPTSPVEEAHAEYVKAKGGNPFMELSVPQAAKKLVQACGRLLRNENDHGRVVILDRRLVSKRYGQLIIDALPPFRRYIE